MARNDERRRVRRPIGDNRGRATTDSQTLPVSLPFQRTTAMTPSTTPPLDRIVDLLAGAERIVVMTGAGMSAESGIPTFRGSKSGLWARFDPEELATADAFRHDMALVWGWYRWRTALVEQARPHPGHVAVAELGRLKPGLVVVTQNVDDLHERAGSADVVHLHGSLFAARCLACARPHPHQRLPAAAALEPELRVVPPDCSHCGGPIRPGVVWFGESLPVSAWQRAEQVSRECDALLVVGTSGVVQPAASLPGLVKQRRKPVIEINPAHSGITPLADVFWNATAAEGLPKVVAGLQKGNQLLSTY